MPICILGALHILLLSYWRIDAPPIIDDYSIANIKSAPLEYNQSYELLNSIVDVNEYIENAPAIGLSIEDINNLHEIYSIFKENDYKQISVRLQDNAEKNPSTLE